MAAGAKSRPAAFDPAAFERFTFGGRELAADGAVALSYTLGEDLHFTERLTLPVSAPLDAETIAGVQGLLGLLHWVAGVSYFKAALPPAITFDLPPPGPAAAGLLEALYSDGLGELAFTNRLPALPRPDFGAGPGDPVCARAVRAAPSAGRGRGRQGLGRRDRGAAPLGLPSGSVLDRRRRADRAHGAGRRAAVAPRLPPPGPAAVSSATRRARSTGTCRSPPSSRALRF